jgi:hypothetical protein
MKSGSVLLPLIPGKIKSSEGKEVALAQHRNRGGRASRNARPLKFQFLREGSRLKRRESKRSVATNKPGRLDYNNRFFAGVANSGYGDFTVQTAFHYRQEGAVVWGTYKGGGVLFGTLIATIDESGCLETRWQYVSKTRELKAGTCLCVPEILPDGRLRLHQVWYMTMGGQAEGTSMIEELQAQ